MHQKGGFWLINPAKKERACVCLWPKWLLSQATNSQNSVSTRPTQAWTRPDPQLTALFHAVLCCAIPGQDWLEWLGVHFYLVESSVSAKRLCKNQLSRQTNAAAICVSRVYVCSWVTVCMCERVLCVLPVVSPYMYMHYMCTHGLWTCVGVFAACNTNVFSCHYKCVRTTGL